jgi:hypothetical protein
VIPHDRRPPCPLTPVSQDEREIPRSEAYREGVTTE